MKPQVFYKPKSPIGNLTPEEAEHLLNIRDGGLMRKATPEHIEENFLEKGYIRRATGGLMATEAGHYALMMWQKGAK